MTSKPSGSHTVSKTQASEPISTLGEFYHANGEIDLIDLIRGLWLGKWLILSITLASTVITLIYWQIFPLYTVSLVIRPNHIAENYVYDDLNAVGWLAVNNDRLLQLWIEDMDSYETLEQALIEHNYLPRKADETEQEFNRRLRQTAYQYELSYESPSNNKSEIEQSYSWSMEFTSSMPETDRLVLEQAFNQSNNNVRAMLEAKFRHKLNSYKQKIIYEIKQSLDFLKEQNQIAHAAGVDISNIPQETLLYDDDAKSTIRNTTLYLRGFKAIEAEIKLLQNRQQNLEIARAQSVFNATPIQSDKFRAVRYNLTDLQIRSKLTLILTLAVILGGVLGVLVLLIRNAVSTSRNEASV